MNRYYSPDGNLEIWEKQPEGYMTDEQWQILHLEISVPEFKAIKKREIASLRYEKEISGIIFGDYLIATDRDSQSLITGAALAAIQDSSYTVRWKTASGFITLTSDQILSVAQAVRTHVQGCFDKEADLTAAIDEAESIAELKSIVWTEAI